MRRLAAVVALAGALVVVPALPAAATADRMRLDCGGALGVIERSNGASWWGIDTGAVYTTKHLRVVDARGTYEKDYGHVGREHVECAADHDVDGYQSDWTVHLVLAG